MVTNDSNTTPGFAWHRTDSRIGLLLPFETVAQLEAETTQAKLAAAPAEKAACKARQETAKAEVSRSALPTKPIQQPGPREVEIFSHDTVIELLDNVEKMESAQRHAAQCVYMALANDGSRYRPVPSIDPNAIRALESQFENMAEPIRQLAAEAELMAHLPPDDFHLTPILLLGDPGVGKTAFASALAKVLGLPYKKLSGSEPSFSLTGSHQTWSKAICGQVIMQLALHQTAAPLFLVDEVDKPNEKYHQMTTALLQLLEPENAKQFKDEFLQINFDASHVVWILTANSTAALEAPLLSRVNVFDIPAPDVAQRKRIIEADFKKLRKRTQVNIMAKPDEVMKLAERIDLDLRKVGRIVRESFISALGQGKRIAELDLPADSKRSIGFM